MRFILYVWLVSILTYKINFKFRKHVDVKCFFFLSLNSFLFKILDEEITPTMQKLQEVCSP